MSWLFPAWPAQDGPAPARFSRDWWVDLLVGTPARILVVVVVAVLARWLVHRAVDRLVARLSAVEPPSADSPRVAHVVLGQTGVISERRLQRAATMGSLFKSIASAAIFTIAIVTILGQLGVDIAPILASAGILGVALGFGAQNLVKDFLSGVFMLLEDQYGVGDLIDMGDAAGTVEAVGLRVTRLRDVEGTVWYVRNGEVVRIGNKSQGWARAVVDVAVGYADDVDRVRMLLLEAADAVRADPEYADAVLEDAEVWGVEQLAVDNVVVRVVVKTAPSEQFRVARELRQRSRAALLAAGIDLPPPTRPAPDTPK